MSSAKYANINKQPKAWHRAHLKRQYGMTREAYDALAQAQGERCAICGTADTGTSAKRNRHHWSVDHCHTTNQIRGLLCNLCNMMLGYARDNPQTLLMAARYLGRGSPKADASVATALLSMGV